MRISDWSSDVFSSDLLSLTDRYGVVQPGAGNAQFLPHPERTGRQQQRRAALGTEAFHVEWAYRVAKHREQALLPAFHAERRSEKRSVGKERVITCRFRWAVDH